MPNADGKVHRLVTPEGSITDELRDDADEYFLVFFPRFCFTESDGGLRLSELFGVYIRYSFISTSWCIHAGEYFLSRSHSQRGPFELYRLRGLSRSIRQPASYSSARDEFQAKRYGMISRRDQAQAAVLCTKQSYLHIGVRSYVQRTEFIPTPSSICEPHDPQE